MPRYNMFELTWKKIPGFPNYEMNALKQIRNIRRGTKMSTYMSDYGERVQLTKGGKRYTRSVDELARKLFPEK